MKITYNYLDISTCTCIDSQKDGSTVTIFSGVHGNEPSGIHATEEFLQNILQRKYKIHTGKIIIVTHANEKAIAKKKRYIEKDLNRLFIDTITGSDYETKRAKQLMNIIQKTDIFLDLHSTSTPSHPFLFTEKEHLSLAKTFGISPLITGRSTLGNTIAGDTENYANHLGKIGLTFEAGDHTSPESSIKALQMIYNILVITEQIDKKYFKPIGTYPLFIDMHTVYIAETEHFIYTIKNPENCMKLSKNTLIGKDGQKKIFSKEDSTLIMPAKQEDIKKGAEVFFLGKEIE